MNKQPISVFLLVAILLCGSTKALAQDAIQTNMHDGSVVSIPVDSLSKITFNEADATITLHDKNGQTAVVSISEIKTITFGEYKFEPSGLVAPQQSRFAITKDGVLHISSPDGIRQVSIYNADGALLFSKNLDESLSDVSLNTGLLKQGVCIVRVRTNTAVVTQKIMVQ